MKILKSMNKYSLDGQRTGVQQRQNTEACKYDWKEAEREL